MQFQGFRCFGRLILFSALALLMLAAITALLPAQSALAATIPVTTVNDDYNTDPSTCSLREAVQAANTQASFGGCVAGTGNDVISLPVGTYVLTQTGANENNNVTGDLDIAVTLTIQGAGAEATIIDANNIDRAMQGLAGVSLTLNDITVRNGLVNVGGAPGGGVYIQDGSATISGTTFISNATAAVGGGLYAEQSVTVTHSSFISNTAVGPGGGLYAKQFVTLTNSTLVSNRGNAGGGVYVLSGGANVLSTTLTANQSLGPAGGLYADQSVTLTRAMFVGNTSVGPGGGIYIPRGGATITGSLFTSNTSGSPGGGVYAVESVLITNTPFISNVAGFGGGGVDVVNGSAEIFNSPFTLNQSNGGPGGGVYASSGGVSIHASAFTTNTAGGPGGGVYATQLLMITNSPFVSNTSTATGGGAYISNGSATLMNSPFRLNTAGGPGGGLFAAQSVTITDSPFLSNTSNASTGGGVYSSNGTAAVTNSPFTANRSGGPGGGLYAYQSVTLINSPFLSNTSVSGGGGGIYTSIGSVSALDSPFTANSTTSPGGGIYASQGVTLTNSPFISNSAQSSGGGVYASNGPVVISNSAFISNTTAAPGGGLYTSQGATIVSSPFISNTSVNGGGGAYLAGGPGIISDSRFESNTTTSVGGGLYAGQAVTITRSSFSLNQGVNFGGGAYVAGIATIRESAFTSNTVTGGGGGLFLNITGTITGTDFVGNVASTNGGGLLSSGPALTLITDTRFSGNSANDRGGAIFSDGDVQAVNTLMHDNAAVQGGTAMYLVLPSRAATLTHVTIANATPMGAAVVVSGTGGTALIRNTIFASNTLALEASSGATVTEDYNLFFGNGADRSGVPSGGQSLTGDPAFIAPALGDYRFKVSSAAIDTGVDLGISPDYFGTPRPQGGAPDIGFFEFSVTPISGLVAENDSPKPIGDRVQLTATMTAGDNVSYTWDFGDGQTGVGANPSHLYDAIGAYTATVTATNAAGFGVATTPVIITDVPVAGLVASNDSPRQVNVAVQFAASVFAGTNVSYTWDFGDGQTGVGATPTHSYATADVYTATVTAQNGAGIVMVTSRVVIVPVDGPQPIDGLIATNDSPKQVGTAVQFTVSVTAGDNVSYTWDFGDGQVGSGATPTHTYRAAGTYVASVIAANTVNSATTTTPVTITISLNNNLIASLDVNYGNGLVSYTLVVTNANPLEPVVNVVVSGSVPANTALISTNGLSVTMGGDYGLGYVALPSMTLAMGEQVTLTWTVRPNDGVGEIVTLGHAASDNAMVSLRQSIRLYRLLLQMILKQAAP